MRGMQKGERMMKPNLLCTCGNKAAWNYHYAKCMQCEKPIPATDVIKQWRENNE
jgi:hypothetical protein